MSSQPLYCTSCRRQDLDSAHTIPIIDNNDNNNNVNIVRRRQLNPQSPSGVCSTRMTWCRRLSSRIGTFVRQKVYLL